MTKSFDFVVKAEKVVIKKNGRNKYKVILTGVGNFLKYQTLSRSMNAKNWVEQFKIVNSNNLIRSFTPTVLEIDNKKYVTVITNAEFKNKKLIFHMSTDDVKFNSKKMEKMNKLPKGEFCNIRCYINESVFMINNNINRLTFEHHDTYIYYVDEVLKSQQEIILTSINSQDTDNVKYRSFETNLFTNDGVNNGLIKFNTFDRNNLNDNITVGTSIVTIITDYGILMFNYATERKSSGAGIHNRQIKSLANYKSGKYANYTNVEFQIDFKETYRIVTISY